MFPGKSDDSPLNPGTPLIHKLGLINMGSTLHQDLLERSAKKELLLVGDVFRRTHFGELLPFERIGLCIFSRSLLYIVFAIEPEGIGSGALVNSQACWETFAFLFIVV